MPGRRRPSPSYMAGNPTGLRHADLENGQNDEYPDEDTVLLSEAFRIVRHIIVNGTPPADAAWTVDR
ncbi:hypothetical protein ACWD4L_08880 [Streptomyces sp. NPDC002596]